jgi:hypothetical protein
MKWWPKRDETQSHVKKQKMENMKHHKNQDERSSNGEHNPDTKKIEHRAYELYLDRGRDPGHDFDDWVRAERELKALGGAVPSKVVL